MKTGVQLLKSSLWVHFAAAAVNERWHFNLLVHCPLSCCLSGWVMELKDREKSGRFPAGKLTPLAACLCCSVESEREYFFFLCWSASSVVWKTVLEENQQEQSQDFKRLYLWICVCWGNIVGVGRGQWPSVTLLFSTVLWCYRIWNGYKFLWSPWQAIFVPSIALVMYISWPKGCPFFPKHLEKKVLFSAHLICHKTNDYVQGVPPQLVIEEMVLCLHHPVSLSSHRFRIDCVLLTVPRAPHLVSDLWDFWPNRKDNRWVYYNCIVWGQCQSQLFWVFLALLRSAFTGQLLESQYYSLYIFPFPHRKLPKQNHSLWYLQNTMILYYTVLIVLRTSFRSSLYSGWSPRK